MADIERVRALSAIYESVCPEHPHCALLKSVADAGNEALATAAIAHVTTSTKHAENAALAKVKSDLLHDAGKQKPALFYRVTSRKNADGQWQSTPELVFALEPVDAVVVLVPAANHTWATGAHDAATHLLRADEWRALNRPSDVRAALLSR